MARIRIRASRVELPDRLGFDHSYIASSAASDPLISAAMLERIDTNRNRRGIPDQAKLLFKLAIGRRPVMVSKLYPMELRERPVRFVEAG